MGSEVFEAVYDIAKAAAEEATKIAAVEEAKQVVGDLTKPPQRQRSPTAASLILLRWTWMRHLP